MAEEDGCPDDNHRKAQEGKLSPPEPFFQIHPECVSGFRPEKISVSIATNSTLSLFMLGVFRGP